MNRTFAGIEEKYASKEKSAVYLIPVPYDGTSTWGKGADKGPEAFLDAAENMELYDIETKSEPYKKGVYLHPTVEENESPEKMTEAVYNTVKNSLKDNKLISLFGGEHSISIGAIRAMHEHYGQLNVLQIDAHTDLRPEYMGTKCNHACAVYEASLNNNLIQVGIRSMDISEVEHMKPKNVFFAHEIHNTKKWQKKVLQRFKKKPVYITIDLDGFDPSIAPSTGTPEPGGLKFYETLKLIKKVIKEYNLVGFDIVELAANENEKSTDFLAAKLYYKILAYYFKYSK